MTAPRRDAALLAAGLTLLALVVLLVSGWGRITGPGPLGGDQAGYHALAQALVRTGDLQDAAGTPTAQRSPGLPLLVTPLVALAPGQPGFAILAPLAAAAVAVGLNGVLGMVLAGSRLVGLAAGLLLLANPALRDYGSSLLTEGPVVALTLATGLALTAWRRTPARWGWLLAAGLTTGLAALVRPHGILLLAATVPWILLAVQASWRTRVLAAAACTGVVIVVLLPWTVRNAIVLDRFVPLSAAACPPCPGIYRDGILDPARGFNTGAWMPGQPIPTAATAEDVADLRRASATDWILANPAQAAAIASLQPVHFWRPDRGDQLVPHLAVLVLAVPGAWILLVRRRNRDAWWWAILAIVMTAAAVATFGIGRYRLPLDPFVSTCAGLMLVRLGEAGWNRLDRLRKQGAGQPQARAVS